MKIPQMLVVGWLALNLGLSLSDSTNKGQPKVFFGTLVGTAIWIGLLTWGGFWK